MRPGASYSFPVTTARAKLSEIVLLVQDPRSCVVMTRHGKAVAAVVSMSELSRIWTQEEVEDIVKHGKRPLKFIYGDDVLGSPRHEAGERVQKVQMDRLQEREILRGAGMEPIPGGEIVGEMAMVVPRRRRWWEVFRRR